jgi:hypothetical protein
LFSGLVPVVPCLVRIVNAEKTTGIRAQVEPLPVGREGIDFAPDSRWIAQMPERFCRGREIKHLQRQCRAPVNPVARAGAHGEQLNPRSVEFSFVFRRLAVFGG